MTECLVNAMCIGQGWKFQFPESFLTMHKERNSETREKIGRPEIPNLQVNLLYKKVKLQVCVKKKNPQKTVQ